MGQIFVKGHTRAGRRVKSYARDLRNSVRKGQPNRAADAMLRKKYMNGYNALGGSRGMGKMGYIRGYDVQGFIFRSVRRAKGMKTSKYG